MYYVIEDNPKDLQVIGAFFTIEQAQKKCDELENGLCNYFITVVTSQLKVNK